MTISLIVAAAENNAIGKNNQLLWKLPNDFKFFKNTTWGMPVVMGRKTYESLGKALPGRFNVVITRQADWKADDAVVVNSLEEALLKAKENNTKEIFIIGGAEIYKQAIDTVANKIYLTRVHTQIDGDAYFPDVDTAKWEMSAIEDFTKDAQHDFDYSFQTWTRR
jgi:dihydrofolate reductase